jgi:hypothetical protein
MKTLKISDSLSLPADAVTQTFAFLAKRGMGKTYAAGVLVEELSETNSQVVVIDPTDAWWGIKSSADGKHDGYPFVIFGGNHSDVPLMEGAGTLLAEFVIDSGQSVIICPRLLSKTKARNLVADFFEALYHIKGQKGKGSPLFCLIDECDLFIPQMVKGDTARCVGAVDDVVRRGRNVGLGVGLVSQRAAKVNKDVLSQTEILVAMQTSGTHDRKALREWIEANADADRMDEFIENIVKLNKGEAWVWSPSWLKILQAIKFRRKRTFDSSRTPGPGESNTTPRKVIDVDLDAVKNKMAATIERAKADNPMELRKKIAELERQLRIPKPAAPAPARKEPEVEKIIVKVLDDEQIVAMSRTAVEVGVKLDELSVGFDSFLRGLGDFQRATASNRAALQKIERRSHRHVVGAPAVKTVAPKRTASNVHAFAQINGHLPEGEKKILTVAAQYPEGATREQISILTGYKKSSRDTYIHRLRNNGYVEVTGDGIIATQTGVDALGDFQPLPTGPELIEYWRLRLPQGERKIFDAAVAEYPDPISREVLDHVTGFKKSSRDTYIHRLNARRLIDTSNRGEIKASVILFE